ncbi:MAG: CRISPR-associated helicase Cas3 [Firmicutes bacterium]|nr:CRISPR-associated helicase Cas3 [Bacillota bacterium]
MVYYSHPDKRLIDHLKEVRQISIEKIDEEYKLAYEVAAYCHDFGKYTTYFQEHLKGRRTGDLSNHGFISAIFAAYVALKVFGDSYKVLPLMIYNCVLHHHGNLKNPSADLPCSIKDISFQDYDLLEKIDIAEKQIDDIRKNRRIVEEDLRGIGYEDYFNEFLDETCIRDILKRLKRIEVVLQRIKSEEYYFAHQLLYSALISADKLGASNTIIPDEMCPDYGFINEARKRKFKGSTDEIGLVRQEIFEKIQQALEESFDKSSVFSITSPTGTGKTYAGFFAALKLRQLLGNERKIIYALPFTSIIEQNYDRLYELFETIGDFKAHNSRYIIKHHNLANVQYKDEQTDYTLSQAEMLIENWTSGVVVTTFVQLLETLIGSRNRMLKKFINLRGAIVLLDEVQAIDIKYFPLVDFIFKKSCEFLDMKIIMMTATKPIFLAEAKELLTDNKKYFEVFNRTKIIPKLEKMTLDGFLEEFKHSLENKSYLVVCNTIKQSLYVYESLKGLAKKVFYLSTNILPVHRRQRINEVKEKLENGEKIILVSTQVVEAGVDLDFDVIIRDIGPIDSIIQCAGRCNRNGKREIGKVYVYNLTDDDGKSFGKYIYGSTILQITRDIIKDKGEIHEKEYYSLVNDYFHSVQQNKSKDISEKLINSIISLNFSENESPVSSFSLISSNPNYIDVLFILDDVSQKVYEQYCCMLKEKDFLKKRELYLNIKNEFRDYTLSLPEKFSSLFIRENGLFIMNGNIQQGLYDQTSGFKRVDNDTFLCF